MRPKVSVAMPWRRTVPATLQPVPDTVRFSGASKEVGKNCPPPNPAAALIYYLAERPADAGKLKTHQDQVTAILKQHADNPDRLSALINRTGVSTYEKEQGRSIFHLMALNYPELLPLVTKATPRLSLGNRAGQTVVQEALDTGNQPAVVGLLPFIDAHLKQVEALEHRFVRPGSPEAIWYDETRYPNQVIELGQARFAYALPKLLPYIGLNLSKLGTALCKLTPAQLPERNTLLQTWVDPKHWVEAPVLGILEGLPDMKRPEDEQLRRRLFTLCADRTQPGHGQTDQVAIRVKAVEVLPKIDDADLRDGWLQNFTAPDECPRVKMKLLEVLPEFPSEDAQPVRAALKRLLKDPDFNVANAAKRLAKQVNWRFSGPGLS